MEPTGPVRDPPVSEHAAKPASTVSSPPNGSSPEITPSVYACPICGESMISLAQLNRHIDDIHEPGSEGLSGTSGSETARNSRAKSARNGSKSLLSTPQKRSLKLDLHENTSRFSLSENGESTESVDSPRLSRSHWKHISHSKTNICAEKSCKNVLNVRNGVVNCRKCGDLFCNEHTRYMARLSNGVRVSGTKTPLPVYDSEHGMMAKVCHTCYLEKPGIKMGTRVKSVDLTSEFLAKRGITIEKKQMAKNITHTRFIRLADLHSQKYLWQLQHQKSLFSYLEKLSGQAQFSRDSIVDAEKEIVGVENWQPDDEVSHCKLCFVKFGLLVRKHHCRLCGSVVDDGTFKMDDPASACSAQVPINLLLKKLPSLNYSPLVKTNWDVLLSASADGGVSGTTFSARICKNCKNLLLHSSSESETADPYKDVLDLYDQILALKATISTSMARYKALIEENKETNNHQTNRLRVRLRKAVKDLEILVNSFFNRFFAFDQHKKLVPVHSPRLVTNIYKASAAYLQESILELKRLNDEFQSAEHQKLAGQLGAVKSLEGTPQSSSSLSATVSPPPTARLTKKQIRELREQLMVTKEQRFIVESLIEDVKRQRKFDELGTLAENRRELSEKIEELTQELGEYGF